MGKFIDLTGQRFGRLTVISRAENTAQGKPKWKCRCDCGCTSTVSGDELRRKQTKSCGCLNNPTKGYVIRSKKLYNVWKSIKGRTLNPNNEDYKYYGGRGITICNDWKDDYSIFEKWALSNGYQEGLTIDRAENDKGYYPDNCRWVDHKTQCNNRRSNNLITFNGKTQTLTEWANEIGVKRHILTNRIVNYGWSVERALSEPVRKQKNNRH